MKVAEVPDAVNSVEELKGLRIFSADQIAQAMKEKKPEGELALSKNVKVGGAGEVEFGVGILEENLVFGIFSPGNLGEIDFTVDFGRRRARLPTRAGVFDGGNGAMMGLPKNFSEPITVIDVSKGK